MALIQRRRELAAVVAVAVLGHALLLWALHIASLGQPLSVVVVVPVRLLATFVAPAAGQLAQAPAPTVAVAAPATAAWAPNV